jgi:hypothetical protein
MGNATSTSSVSVTMFVMCALVFIEVLRAQNARLSNITAALTGAQYFFKTDVEPGRIGCSQRRFRSLTRRIAAVR